MAAEALSAALVGQIGDALNNLHDLVLNNQKSSERWRLDLDRKLDERFAAVEERLKSVCDEGKSEHDAMRARLTVLELNHERALARQAGREQVMAFIAKGSTWAVKHGLTVLLVAYVLWDGLLLPMIQSALASEPVEIRGSL